MKMKLSDLVAAAHGLSRSKGWYEGELNVPEKLALIHSEVSEALEEYRIGAMASREGAKGKPEGFPTELADIVIRVADLAGALGIDLEAEVTKKHAFNATRPHRHGGKVC
jgi:NTP pyrophosphatase (non-canonical NTP hydrolase)